MPSAGGTPVMIDTAFANRCNNDHGISPDGKTLAISDQSAEPHKSIIYTVSIEGGTPTRITQQSPSYFHGWSPDGKTLAFCGRREGNSASSQFHPSAEMKSASLQLPASTTARNSPLMGNLSTSTPTERASCKSGACGPTVPGCEQMTSDDSNNWFPHLSPDGRSMAFLSYDKDVKGHPPDKEVTVRLMMLEDRKITVLAKLLGGQGTINVSSWSPDGPKLAFVSYELIPSPTP